MISQINIYPHKTEKAYNQSLNNVYVFDVPVSANKQQIIEAVESQFNVKTVGIKTLIQAGKIIRTSIGKRNRPVSTNRKDMKKAYVTLVSGHSIKVFDEVVAADTDKKSDNKEKK
jgi:ribosomal protein L23